VFYRVLRVNLRQDNHTNSFDRLNCTSRFMLIVFTNEQNVWTAISKRSLRKISQNRFVEPLCRRATDKTVRWNLLGFAWISEPYPYDFIFSIQSRRDSEHPVNATAREARMIVVPWFLALQLLLLFFFFLYISHYPYPPWPRLSARKSVTILSSI